MWRDLLTCALPTHPNTKHVQVFTLLIILLILFSGCRNSDSSEGDTTAPTINVASHADGQDIIGDRAITLAGTVSSDTTSISITQNGNPITHTQPDSSNFTANITLNDIENVVVITASDSSGNTSTNTTTINYPYLALDNGQLASTVIGQLNFTSSGINNSSATPVANGLNTPKGSPTLSANGKLMIADTRNSRVLVFNQIPPSGDNGVVADSVIGQPDFETESDPSQAVAATTLFSPQKAILMEDNKLLVADTGNSRILIWDQMPADSTVVGADTVIGQAGPGLSVAECGVTSLSYPRDMFIINNKLIVVDTDNNRVLIWNSIPTTNIEADIVLGQLSLDTCAANDSDGDGLSDSATVSLPEGVPADTTLMFPFAVWSDGDKLIVADTFNNRVLIWNVFPSVSAQKADVVLGQADMQSNLTLLPSSTSLVRPVSLASNGNQLFIGLRNESRVLIWDGMPTTDQEPADRIIGQDTFTGTAKGVTQKIMESVRGVLVTDRQLLIADEDDNRVLIFDTP